MKSKIRNLIIFLITIFTISVFANEEGTAPNEIIKDNPEREVTTVESMKTREHATMSLSITKAIPEEIMGRFKDGRLSVFIPKNRKQPRKMSNDIDVSKFKLQAYSNPKTQVNMLRNDKSFTSNNLSPEDIRKMMNNSSKEKKINVIENTDEYVRLDVEDVTENEKVYISVMNGDKVVKSYRIGEVVPLASNPITCWGAVAGGNSWMKDTTFSQDSRKYPLGDTQIDWMTDKLVATQQDNGFVSATLDPIPSTSDELTLQDDFIKNHSIRPSKFWLANGFRLIFQGTTKWTIYGENVILSNGHTFGTTTTENDGDWKNVRFGEGNTNIGDIGGINKDEVVSTFKGLGRIYEGKVGIDDECYGKVNYKYKSVKGKILLGFNIKPTGFTGTVKPGVYLYKDAIGVILRSYPVNVDGNKGPTKDHKYKMDYYVDMGSPKPIAVNQTLYGLTNETIIIKTEGETALSFMKKGTAEERLINGQKAGIWRNSNDSGDQPINNVDLSQGGFDVTSEDKLSKIKVAVSQTDGNYAQLNIKLVENKSKNSPVFKFTLSQGRYAKNDRGDTELRKHRVVEYTLTWQNATKLGDIIYNVDSRIEGTNGEWITPKGEVKRVDGDIVVTLPEFVDASDDITLESKNFDSVEIINGKRGNQLQTGVLNGINYMALKDEAPNKLALPYGVTVNEYKVKSEKTKILINKEDLDNLTKESRADISKTNTFMLKARDESYWSGSITETYKGSKNPNSGNGSIDMSNATLGSEYAFAPGRSNPPSNGNGSDTKMILTTNNSLDGRGRLSKNNAKSIVNKLIIKVNGQNSQTIGNDNSPVGRVDPVAITYLEEKIGIGISEDGGIILKKMKDETLTGNTKTITVEYWYKNCKLGEFNLTVTMIKPIVASMGEITATFDKRFENSSRPWVIKENSKWVATNTINNGATFDYSRFWDIKEPTEDQKPKFIEGETIDENSIEVENRTYNKGTYTFKGTKYKVLSAINDWPNSSPIPVGIAVKDFYSKLAVHTYNTDTYLDNKFTLKGNKGSTYNGNIKEVYVKVNHTGNGNSKAKYYEGSGTIDLTKLDDNKEYKFSPDIKDGSIDVTSPSGDNVKITNASDPVNTKGLVGTYEDKNIANKIMVKYIGDNSQAIDTKYVSGSSGTIITTSDNLTVGIDTSTCGLVLKKSNPVNNTKQVEITYYFEAEPTNTEPNKDSIILGKFTLNIEEASFELEDGELDFGNMVYRASDPIETRVKTFKVTNPTNKAVEFKVNSTTSKMYDNKNPRNEIDLTNIQVKTESDTSFTLQASAVLTPQTVPGAYSGSIEVVVTIKDEE